MQITAYLKQLTKFGINISYYASCKSADSSKQNMRARQIPYGGSDVGANVFGVNNFAGWMTWTTFVVKTFKHYIAIVRFYWCTVLNVGPFQYKDRVLIKLLKCNRNS